MDGFRVSEFVILLKSFANGLFLFRRGAVAGTVELTEEAWIQAINRLLRLAGCSNLTEALLSLPEVSDYFIILISGHVEWFDTRKTVRLNFTFLIVLIYF